MSVGLFLISVIAAVAAFSSSPNTTYYVTETDPKSLVPTAIRAVLPTVLWPDFMQTTPVYQVNARSNISCSFRAMKSGVATFTFEEDTCSLFGSEGTPSGQVFVYRRIPSPLDGSLEEVALGKLTNSSNIYSSFTTEKAVDGSIDDADRYHSANLVKPWWWVDLGEEKTIYQIQIYPRQSYDYRFHDVEVRTNLDPKL
ncbi:uncharacterized protein [Palaemon carinicauda]|uniref:uncharacterized protein n=1 Tax=Palaemon carinicauda TaxID=392227 RepID=UPI0035B62519